MPEIRENIAAPAGIESPVVTFKKRGAMAKGNIRKRPTNPALSPGNDSSDSSDSSSEHESGHNIKRRKKNTGVVTASSANNKPSDQERFATNFTASRNVSITNSNDATKQSNWFDEDSKDALPPKSLQPITRATPNGSQIPDGTYKGLANQASFIQRNPDAPKKSVGPIKAPTNIRTTMATDFSPDVCKDYKQTGFCGFGDSCKFLHDRSDYKQGWQLDREWETVTGGKKLGGTVIANANRSKVEEEGDDNDAMLEDIPFACIICKGPYREPIITRCRHYFCERCALQRYRKEPGCAACGSGTNGVFNSAKMLKKLLEKKAKESPEEEN